jgi:hypothetical protein
LANEERQELGRREGQAKATILKISKELLLRMKDSGPAPPLSLKEKGALLIKHCFSHLLDWPIK